MELMPVISDIQVTLKHLGRWMQPQKRAIDRKIFGLASNRVIPQPLGVVGRDRALELPDQPELPAAGGHLRRRQPRDGEDERELAPSGASC